MNTFSMTKSFCWQTFTQYVQGNEVEWSLGLALYEFAEEKRLDPVQESEV